MSVGGGRSAPLPRRPRRSTRWSPLRARVAHGTRADANRRLAIRATAVGAAALAVGWYLGPEDGLIPVVVLAGLGGWLGIRRAREVWARRTVGRSIRRSVGETPISLGAWRVAGSGYWLRPSADPAAMPPPAPTALAGAGVGAVAGPAPWAMEPPRALAGWPAAAAPMAGSSTPTFIAQPVAPLAVASTTFAAPTAALRPVAQPAGPPPPAPAPVAASPAPAPVAPAAWTPPPASVAPATGAPAAPSASPGTPPDGPIFPWAPPRDPWPPSTVTWPPAPPGGWHGHAQSLPAGPAWGAPATWPPPTAARSGVRHGPLWGPGVAAAPPMSPPPGTGARWMPVAHPGGALVPAGAGAWSAAATVSPAAADAGVLPGCPTTRVPPGQAWPQAGWAPSPWIATSAGLGWRPPSSGVGPFQPGDEVELLATSAWIWVCGPRIERYARAATVEVIGEDGLAITDGEAALRRWITLVPDEDDAVPWAVAQLAELPVADPPTPPTDAASKASVPMPAEMPGPATPAPTPHAPVAVVPPTPDDDATPKSSEADDQLETPADPRRRAARRWDDPRSAIDDSR